MTPKEKALNLIDRFENYSFMDIEKRLSSFSSAKQCALIAVDEQISLYNELNQLGLLKDNSVGFELAKLKEEINKL
jgi:hypothetical protein